MEQIGQNSFELLHGSNFKEPLFFRIYARKEPQGFSWTKTAHSGEWPDYEEWQDDLILELESEILYEIEDVFTTTNEKWDEYGVTDYQGKELERLIEATSNTQSIVKQMAEADFTQKFKELAYSLESEGCIIIFDAETELHKLQAQMVAILEYMKNSFKKVLETNGCIVIAGI